MTSRSTKARLAVIGVSGYGRIHLQLARECRDRGEAKIVAAVVINPEEEAANVAELRAHGTAIFSNYEEMLRVHEGGIDLCLIPTGIHWHARMTIAALRAGANVLVEKPLAGSVADARAVRNVERETRRFVAVGFQDCYDPATLWLVNELAAGAIGSVRAVKFLGVWPRPRAYFARNNWAGRMSVDGTDVLDSPLNNAFAHFVMLSLLFAGVTEEAAGLRTEGVELFRAHAIESFDTGVAVFRTAENVKLWFGASHLSRRSIEPEIFIQGSQGSARWLYEKEASHTGTDEIAQRRQVADQTAARRRMMEAVMRRLKDPAALICDTSMAIRHTATIAAVHAAGPVIPFPSDAVEWEGEGGAATQIASVPGLDEALRRAYSDGRLLRDSNFVSPLPATGPRSGGRDLKV